jgi:RNA polymerase sigma factor (sigma-70 family)
LTNGYFRWPFIPKYMQTRNYSDTEIIQKILQGEAALFEILIRRNNPHLYKIGRSYGYDHEDVQDLMQETFISAYLNLSKFEYRSAFKTWIIRIMLNLCFQKRHKSGYKNEIKLAESINENSTPMFADNNYTNTDKTILVRELNHVIEEVLEEIPLDYKMVFSLREITGLNVAETSEILNISEANVKVRLNRAKNMIKSKIEKVYVPEDLYEFNLIYCDKIVENVMKAIKEISPG